MPKFEVRLVFEFAPGQVNGVTEKPPADLLDKRGHLLRPLGIWPQQTAKLEAANPDEAIGLLKQKWIDESHPIFLDEAITRERFAELENRPRPGQEQLNSLVACWQARPQGQSGAWHMTYETFNP